MNIDILVNDGSPLGLVPSDVYGLNDRVGIGGAELALFTMCELWVQQGYRVRLYNSPRLPQEVFEQLPLSAFNKHDARDHLIVFRSPTSLAVGAKGQKIWWSHDYYTTGDFRQFARDVDKIVVNSPFHASIFDREYGIKKTIVMDLVVRAADYTVTVEKVRHRLLFSSVPNRGLDIVASVFPRIVREVPDVSLVITSDFRLWGMDQPRNEESRERFASFPNVRFLGAVRRAALIEEQLIAQVLLYPCTYGELFCIAVSEAQVCGLLPITSAVGALPTTNMGVVIAGHPRDPDWQSRYVQAVVKHLTSDSLSETQARLRTAAIKRFKAETIGKQWDSFVFA